MANAEVGEAEPLLEPREASNREALRRLGSRTTAVAAFAATAALMVWSVGEAPVERTDDEMHAAAVAGFKDAYTKASVSEQLTMLYSAGTDTAVLVSDEGSGGTRLRGLINPESIYGAVLGDDCLQGMSVDPRYNIPAEDGNTYILGSSEQGNELTFAEGKNGLFEPANPETVERLERVGCDLESDPLDPENVVLYTSNGFGEIDTR